MILMALLLIFNGVDMLEEREEYKEGKNMEHGILGIAKHSA